MQLIRSGSKGVRRFVGPIVGIGIFAVALWLLQHELSAYNYRDVVQSLGEIPAYRLLLALALTAANFVVLTGFDVLALRFIRRRLDYRRVFLASFTGFAFSQALGFPLLTGGSVRYRLYSAWGLCAEEVTNVVAFSGLTFFLGLFTISGLVLVGRTAGTAELLALPGWAAQIIGALLLLAVVSYLVWNVRRTRPLRVWRWSFPVSSPRMTLLQMVVSSLDWVLAASVLFVLLPAGTVSYHSLVQIFVLAQFTGIVSHVPGGLGVFEAVFFLLVPDHTPESLVLASLLAYRGIYTLLPLVTAAILFAVHEGLKRRGRTAPPRTGG
jgi:uncharacterized membrane protein YbhN (UPF0104 family)